MTRYFSIENLEVRFGSTDHTYNRRFFYHGNVLHILSLTSHNGDIYCLDLFYPKPKQRLELNQMKMKAQGTHKNNRKNYQR